MRNKNFNNKLDDRNHFQQNAKTSVASLRGLIGSSRNIDRHHSGMLIAFIGIPMLATHERTYTLSQFESRFHWVLVKRIQVKTKAD
jgi:hypothetical protein